METTKSVRFPLHLRLPIDRKATTGDGPGDIRNCTPDELEDAELFKPRLAKRGVGDCVYELECKTAKGRYPSSWWQASLVNKNAVDQCEPPFKNLTALALQRKVFGCRPNLSFKQMVLERDDCSGESWALRRQIVPLSFACLLVDDGQSNSDGSLRK